MALNTKKAAEKAEPEKTPTKPVESTDADKAKEPETEVKTDDDGKAINEGDANTTSTGPSNTPVASLAPENGEGATAAQKAADDAKRAKEEAEARGEDDSEVLVKVKNVRTQAFRQPSTGTWVNPGQTAHLIADGWLNNHVKADLLEYATESEKNKAQKAHEKRSKKKA